MSRRPHRHKKGRPLDIEGVRSLLRLTDEHEWVPDDGEPGLAFIGLFPRGVCILPVHWYFDCGWHTHECPQEMAARRNCELHGASNGRPMAVR